MNRNQSAGNVLRRAEKILSGKGVPESRLDAELLLAHLLNIDRMDFLAGKDITVSEDTSGSYLRLYTGGQTACRLLI